MFLLKEKEEGLKEKPRDLLLNLPPPYNPQTKDWEEQRTTKETGETGTEDFGGAQLTTFSPESEKME